MKTVLVVSPHFPPINAADMHRVRISLSHFQRFGWNPIVLAVAPQHVEGVNEPLLMKSLRDDLPVYRVSALPVRLTRKFGLGNLGLRSIPFLYRAGCQLIREHAVELVYFSTTVFPVMPLGRLWKRKFGVPFVLDIQDPWRSDYYVSRPGVQKPQKYRAAASMHRILEPWTMQNTDGLLAVSADYIQVLTSRYPRLTNVPKTVLPFGAAESDFDMIRANSQPNRFFQPGDGKKHGVYLGRGGPDMAPALRIVFGALRRGIQQNPELFSKVRLHFVGTDYAPPDRARKTVEPIAEELGVLENVEEHPARVPYFEGLQLLLDSDFLIVPGSDDPQYTASKIFPYILARKPLLAVFHHRSSVCDLLRSTNAGKIVPFDPHRSAELYSSQLLESWISVLKEPQSEAEVNWNEFARYSELESARRQCEIFSQVESGMKTRTDMNVPVTCHI